MTPRLPENVRFAWLDPGCWSGFRTAVSLHSHTSHSREPMDFFPLRSLGEKAWWTPPLAPREAWELECAQIRGLGLQPLVSLTDHDDIEAPLRLRVLHPSRHTPVSVEWSVPYEGAMFHLGLHGLPPRRARECMAALSAYSRDQRAVELDELLAWLSEQDETLVVFNHPCWDERRLGGGRHMELVGRFMRRYRGFLHALELNGLRPWPENAQVLALAERTGLPVISGGDRHGCEPNANLNLTQARNFAEFVDEIRHDGRSRVLFLPQYRSPHVRRVTRIVFDVLRDHEDHGEGWRRWSDRIFCRRPDGSSASLTQYWPALLGAAFPITRGRP